MLTSDWIKTEFNNQNTPASFYTVSSEFSASSLCALLPIELLDFSATNSDKNEININWKTATEINNDFFTLERSTNGTDWKTINTTKGAGNSSTVQSYDYIDNEALAGFNYYRLKQTDFDGQYEYFDIINVKLEKFEDTSIDIFPNPANNKITIVANQLDEISIYNAIGQDVTILTSEITNNGTRMVIDLSELNKGVYFVKTNSKVNKIYKQ